MNKVLLAAAVPILALIGWAGMLQLRIQHGTHIKVRAQGYDPRDLLTGHYIRFSLNLGPDACTGVPNDGPACVCLAREVDGFYTAISAIPCETGTPSCGLFMRGECRWSRFNAGVERYSIPEDLAPVLQRAPEDSSVVLAVDSNGIPQIVSYLVGDEPVESWARRKLLEIENPAPVAGTP